MLPGSRSPIGSIYLKFGQDSTDAYLGGIRISTDGAIIATTVAPKRFNNSFSTTDAGELCVVKDYIIMGYVGGLPYTFDGRIVYQDEDFPPMLDDYFVGGIRLGASTGIYAITEGGDETLGSVTGVEPGTLDVESRDTYPAFTGTISVTSGNGEVSKNGDNIWGISVTLIDTDYYQARGNASASYDASVIITVDLPDTFTITTKSEPAGNYALNPDGSIMLNPDGSPVVNP